MTVSLLIISFSWTMIFSISVWTSSSFNSVPLLQIAQRRQHAEQIAALTIAALTEEIEELRSRQAMDPAQPRLQERRRSSALWQLSGQAGRNAGAVGDTERKPCTAAFRQHKTVP